MIELEVGGRSYSTWVSVEVERSLDTISGVFRFDAITSPSDPFPIPRGQSCRVRINNKIVMTGYVDKIDVRYGSDMHRISISGRDKTCDIVDSHIDHTLEFKAPITIEEVVKRTLQAIQATGIRVINKVPGLRPFTKEELVSGKIGEKAFEFMDKYAAKRQIVLTTDGLGNVVIARASQKLESITIRNVVGSPSNNIKSAIASYDDSGRYGSYTFITQANHSSEPDMTDSPEKSTNRRYLHLDKGIRTSRRFVAIAEGNSKEQPLEDRAKWEANIREARSFKYTCVHTGHSPWSWEGEPYQPNTLLTVNDEFAGVNSPLLLVRVIHRLDMENGSTTELELMSREAFLLTRNDQNQDGTPKKKTLGNPPSQSKFAKYDNSVDRYFERYYKDEGKPS